MTNDGRPGTTSRLGTGSQGSGLHSRRPNGGLGRWRVLGGGQGGVFSRTMGRFCVWSWGVWSVCRVSVDLTEWASGDGGGLVVAVVSLDLSENLGLFYLCADSFRSHMRSGFVFYYYYLSYVIALLLPLNLNLSHCTHWH